MFTWFRYGIHLSYKHFLQWVKKGTSYLWPEPVFRKGNVIDLRSPFPSILLLKGSQALEYCELGKWTLTDDLDQRKKISNTFDNPEPLKFITLNFSTGDQSPSFFLQSCLEAGCIFRVYSKIDCTFTTLIFAF